MPAFPIKLSRPDGRRRMEFLEEIHRIGLMTIDVLDTKQEKEDLRWLWRRDLLSVNSVLNEGKPTMVYHLSFLGLETVELAPSERRRVFEKQEEAAPPCP